MTYLLRHVLRAAITVAAISLVVFTLTRLSGDPAAVLIPPEASPEQAAALRSDLGLDRPLPFQYVTFVRHAATGDFGESFRFRAPASELFWSRFPATLQLAGVATLIALAGGTATGLASAVAGRSVMGWALAALLSATQAIPAFVAALLLVAIFAVELGWLPSSGKGGPATFILPATSLALFAFAAVGRLVRAAALEALRSDFVRCARMKGLPERLVLVRHVLPHVLVPVAAVFSLQVAFFVSGSVIIETIFAWPGIGQLTVQAILVRDYALVQAIVFFTSITVVLIGVLADLVTVVLDPRIRRA